VNSKTNAAYCKNKLELENTVTGENAIFNVKPDSIHSINRASEG
jgi:hypothetical protein